VADIVISAADPASVARHVLAAAALVREFDPLALMASPIDPAVRAQALALIAQEASEIEWSDPNDPSRRKTYWRLDPSARRRVLAALVNDRKLDDTLRWARPIKGDTFADHLRAALTGGLDPEKIAEDQRDAAVAAATFAAEALGPQRGAAAHRAAHVLRDIVSRKADDRRLSAVALEVLTGHGESLTALEAFADTGTIPEGDRLPAPNEAAVGTRAYLVTGAPGAGKSVLAANLVRRRRGYLVITELSRTFLPRVVGFFGTLASKAGSFLQRAAEKAPNRPVVLLDFRTQAIALGGELEWTSEATRQLGYGREELTKRLSDMRAAIRVAQSRLDPAGKGALAALTAASDMKDGMATTLGEQGFADAPLLVVIDSFEEVTHRSFPANDDALPLTLFGRVLLWADSLAALRTTDAKFVFSAVRVIVCGRDKPDMDEARLARWFVGQRVIATKPTVETKETPATPHAAPGAETPADLFARMQQRLSSAGGLPDGTTVERIQAVAVASLALREVTPDLLRDVLVPAAGVAAISPPQAKALFDRLATETWLFTKAANEQALRPQLDVRRIMMSTGSAPEQANATDTVAQWALRVHRNAADWYAARAPGDEAARLEAAYHRAFLPEPFAEWLAVFAPADIPRLCRRLADSAEGDLPAMPLAARALLRFYGVGPLRLTAEESAALPPDLAAKAEVERLEFARREGRGVATAATPARPARGAPPPAVVPEATIADTGTASPPYRLYDLLADRNLGARVRYAFAVGDFDEAAGLGWTAIGTVPDLPDLSDPLRTADDPVTHWVWMASLARLASGDQWPPAGQIERVLSRVIDSTNPERAGANPAGLWLAAAGTIALEGRLPAAAASERLVTLTRGVRSAAMHADLRAFALHPLWRTDQGPPVPVQISVPLNRLPVFRREFHSDMPALPGLGRVADLVKRMIKGEIRSRDIDAQLAANEPSVLFSDAGTAASLERAGIGRMVTGMQPELYDVAVFAMREADRKNRGDVDQAIREIAVLATYWPADVTPEGTPVRDRDRRAGLLARAIMHADRCGLLPDLLRKVAAQSDNPRLIQIGDLAVRYAAVLRQGWMSQVDRAVQRERSEARVVAEATAPAMSELAAPAVVTTRAAPIVDDHQHSSTRVAMSGHDQTISRDQSRKAHNEEFVQRLLARRPHMKQAYDKRLQEAAAQAEPVITAESAIPAPEVETLGLPPPTPPEIVAETIVFEERPVLFVRHDWIDPVNVTKKGEEAEELVKDLETRRKTIEPLMPLIGRIDVVGFPGSDFIGTGWFVESDIVVTNRHVASLIAQQDGRSFVFKRGVTGEPMTSSLSTLHEFDDLAADASRQFAVKEVLYIEPESGPNDIAFLRVARRTDGSKRDRIAIAGVDAPENLRVVVVGYPARAPKRIIPNQQLMKELYRDRFDVKRAAPGFTMATQNGVSRHDCTTLGGNSGSVVLDLATGDAVGLHFAGLYQESNRAVRASVLNDYVKTRRWTRPPVIEAAKPARKPAPPAKPAMPAAAVPQSGAVTVTIPLSITVSLGQPVTGALQSVQVAAARTEAGDIDAAVMAFWDQRPDGVIAARVGYDEEGDRIGDDPFIAASVSAGQLDAVQAAGPASFGGFAVRYLPANVTEQIEARPDVESVDSIAYDDDARTGKGFSFDAVEESMTVRAHVGPEYSWEELHGFLDGVKTSLVSAIYEFHAVHIKDAIEQRLKKGVSLKLVMDNVTFSEAKGEEEFERIEVFKKWSGRFGNKFERIVAPEGTSGLISDAYHIKVSVREDDTFWLSSGNWKPESSQPVITQQQRDEAEDTDLPGNREWHVVIKNKTLASCFRNHIVQDFKRSTDLGGGLVPKSKEATDVFVDVAIEEAELERKPPSRILKPLVFTDTVKVTPLLTPDQEGAVYSEAVLKLIRSARKSLLFQIPYIAMPSNPRADRGFIDELIKALVEKLKTLDDARVILRVGGSKFSAPTHAAWFFKSKGVDIDERLRQIENHHTKGMIVDGKRVLIGSHNWSKPGVTLNRDASLIFDDERLAAYFTESFEIDWKRANPIRPKRFVKEQVAIQEAAGSEPPLGYRRVRLSELLKEDG
jgi:hypothetical protein